MKHLRLDFFHVVVKRDMISQKNFMFQLTRRKILGFL